MKDGYSIFVNDLEGLGYLPEAGSKLDRFDGMEL
jgi:hypothetical protein